MSRKKKTTFERIEPIPQNLDQFDVVLGPEDFIQEEQLTPTTKKGHIEMQASQIINCFEDQAPMAIDSIMAKYKGFCESDEAKRLGVTAQPETYEMRLRLTFECLCFWSFCCCMMAGKFITERRWVRKRPDKKMVNFFNGAIAYNLTETCEYLGATELQEIDLVEIDADFNLTFGFGDDLNPVNRLDEHLRAFTEEPGSEIENFANLIGKSLDAPHYLKFSPIGCLSGVIALKFAENVMASTFQQ